MSIEDGKFPDEIKRMAYGATAGYCKLCEKQATQLHHGLVHNTQVNRRLYPNLVCSFINAIPLCADCHQKYPNKFNISDREAAYLELWIKMLKGEVE